MSLHGKGEEVRRVEHPFHLVDILGGQRRTPLGLLGGEFSQQHVANRGRHIRRDLDPGDEAEPAVPDFLLDDAEQVLRLVLVHLDVRIPRDAEEVPADDRHTREELFEVGADQLFQRHEMIGRPHRHPAGEDLGHLDPGESFLLFLAGQDYGDGEAQVRDVGEGMGRVHRQRRQHREDVFLEIAIEGLAVLGADVGQVEEVDPAQRQLGSEQALAGPVLGLEVSHHRADGPQLRFRGHSVVAALGVAGAHLFLEAGDADLEELVKVGAEDAEELQALEEGSTGVQRLVQHPPIELEPAQLTVEKERRMGQVYRRRCGGMRGGHRRRRRGCGHGLMIRAGGTGGRATGVTGPSRWPKCPGMPC